MQFLGMHRISGPAGYPAGFLELSGIRYPAGFFPDPAGSAGFFRISVNILDSFHILTKCWKI